MFIITSLQPAGETRTPTPAWSGLGFSCSMPEAVIRFVIMIVIRFSLVLGATSAILYCRSGCMCCVIISSRLRSFRFCYRELEHSKARAAREKEVVNTWLNDQSSEVFDHICLIPNSSWTFRSLRTVTGLVPPSTLLASPWSLAGIINFFAV